MLLHNSLILPKLSLTDTSGIVDSSCMEPYLGSCTQTIVQTEQVQHSWIFESDSQTMQFHTVPQLPSITFL